MEDSGGSEPVSILSGDAEMAGKNGVIDSETTDADVASAKSQLTSLPLWKGNWNVYWVLSTALGLWFLFIHTPFFKVPQDLNQDPGKFQDPFFLLHLIAAYAVYLICMWNTFHTPSHGKAYCTAHVWLGRIAVALGPIMFVFGLICAWVPSYNTPTALAGGLTGGGAVHMVTSGLGYVNILRWRKEQDPVLKATYLDNHIKNMLSVFVPACGTPAAMRVAAELGLSMEIALPVFIGIFILLTWPFHRAIVKQKVI